MWTRDTLPNQGTLDGLGFPDTRGDSSVRTRFRASHTSPNQDTLGGLINLETREGCTLCAGAF